MIDNSLEKLLTFIEPKIQSIEEHRIECSSLKSVRNTMIELVELGNSSYKEILDFYDQDFIFKAIKIGNSDSDILIDKFKSAKYLLKNERLSDLPQYKESLEFVEQLEKYLYGLNEKIKLDYDTKSDALKVEELFNKYYNILSKDNVFIKDIDEFIAFLNLCDLGTSDRINILITINKSNIKNYITTNDIDIGNNINLSDIVSLLTKYKEDLTTDYEFTDYDLHLNEYLEKNKDDLENCLNLRRKYLINKINELYQIKKYYEITDLYKEVTKIEELKMEFDKQNNSLNKLIFLFKNNKSLVRDYLDKTGSKFKSCVFKNLLDLETNKSLNLPKMCYNNHYLYLKDEFVVKTIYTYIDNYILVLGVLDKNELLEDFVKNNEFLLDKVFEDKDNLIFDNTERNIILKDINIEDLVVSIDLDTLDVKVEEENGR